MIDEIAILMSLSSVAALSAVVGQVSFLWAISKSRRKLAKAMLKKLEASTLAGDSGAERTLDQLARANDVDLKRDLRLIEQLLVRFERTPSVLSASIDKLLNKESMSHDLAVRLKEIAAKPDGDVAKAVFEDVASTREKRDRSPFFEVFKKRIELAAIESAVQELDQFLERRVDRREKEAQLAPRGEAVPG